MGGGSTRWQAADRGYVLLVAVFCGIFFAARVWMSQTLGVDDVEQVIYAQGFRLSYEPSQPPLYTWLLWLAFESLGVSVSSVALIRYGLLFLSYVFLQRYARRILPDAWQANLAAASVSLVYLVGWGAHGGFTHSTLLMTCMNATLWASARLAESSRTRDYAILGVTLGLGLLSKHNYALVPVGLVVAGLLQPALRARLADRRLALTALIAVAIVAPTLGWLVGAPDLRHALSITVMHQYHSSAPPHARPAPLLALREYTQFSLAFLFPFFPVALALLPQGLVPLRAPTPMAFDALRLLRDYILAVWLLLALACLAGVLTTLETRWLHPVLLWLPLLYVARALLNGAGRRWVHCYIGLLVAANLALAGLWTAQPWLGGKLKLCGKQCRLFAPYPALAQAVAEAGFRTGTIAAGDEFIGGNLRLAFPHAAVLVPQYAAWQPGKSAGNGDCLVVWNTFRQGLTPPAELADLLRARFALDPVSLPVPLELIAANRVVQKQVLHFAFVVIPGGIGGCR